jgi:acetyltransferase EpsM
MQTPSGTVPVLVPAEVDPILWVVAVWVHEGQLVEAGQRIATLAVSQGQRLDLCAPEKGVVIGLAAHSGQPVAPGEAVCGLSTILDNMKPAVLICGGGGHGKAVIELIRAIGRYAICGVIDDGLPVGMDVLGVPVLGDAMVLKECRAQGVRLAVNAVGGIGNPAVRERIFERLLDAGYVLPPVVHPNAVVEASAVIADGVHVLAQAYIGSAAQIGFGTIINAGAIVSHDCILGRVTNLSPGAALAGNVQIEDYAQIGMNASVNLHVTIGSRCIIGNGATVKADVPAGTRVWAGSVWPVRST